MNDEEINVLKRIIETNENCNLEIQKSFNCIHLRNNTNETELRILFLGNLRLTISRVFFYNKRIGTMTSILNELIDFCEKNQIRQLVAQSVLTKEMSNFCLKNGFIPDENTILFEGFLSGDYILNI